MNYDMKQEYKLVKEEEIDDYSLDDVIIDLEKEKSKIIKYFDYDDIKYEVKEICEPEKKTVMEKWSLVDGKYFKNGELYKEYPSVNLAKIKTDDYVNVKTFSGIFSINFECYPNLKYVVYNNCKYIGSESNPYYLLLKAIPDENNNIVLHKDTVASARYAFTYFDEKEKQTYLNFNKLIIGPNYNESVAPLSGCHFNEVLLQGRSYYYTLRDFSYFSNCDFIVSPKMQLSEYRDNSVRKSLLAGFLNYRGICPYDENVENSYIKYLHTNYKNILRDVMDNQLFLDYFIYADLLDQDDVQFVMSHLNKDSDNYYKILTYAKSKNFKYREIDLASLYYLMESLYYPIEDTLPYVETVKFKKYSDKLNISNVKKQITMVKSFLNQGDIFFGVYNSKVPIYLKVQKNKLIKQVTFIEVMNTLYQNDSLLNYDIDENSIINTQYYHLLTKKTNELIEWDYIVRQKLLSLEPHMGIFRKNSRAGEVFEINNFINSSEVIITKEMYNFFEPYFFIEFKCQNVLFRKVSTFDDIKYYLENQNSELLLDIIDIKCSIMKPYFKIENVYDYYICEDGTKYLLLDLLQAISKRLVAGDRTMNLYMLFMELGGFYGEIDFRKYRNLSKSDLEYILDKYFFFERNRGYYHSCDTIVECNNDLIFYDREWFEIFFNAVKKHAGEIKSINDLSVPRYKQRFLNLKNIEKKHLGFFVEAARLYTTVDLYLQDIEKFLINNKDIM